MEYYQQAAEAFPNLAEYEKFVTFQLMNQSPRDFAKIVYAPAEAALFTASLEGNAKGLEALLQKPEMIATALESKKRPLGPSGYLLNLTLRRMVHQEREVLGSGALQVAVRANRCDALEILVEYGGDVNERLVHPLESLREPERTQRASETPLHEAVRCGSKEAAIWLLERGADLDAKNCNSRTPYQLANEGEVDDGGGRERRREPSPWLIEARKEIAALLEEYATRRR